jgi:tetratricopeptide (TPR) repeat protein
LERRQLDSIAALGFNLYQQGRMAEAEAIFEGLILVDDSFYGYAGMGALELTKDPPRLDRAATNLRRAIELNPADPTVHANLGEALLRQGKFQDAAAEFERALDLDPHGVDAGANRARAIISGMELVIAEARKTSNAAAS